MSEKNNAGEQDAIDDFVYSYFKQDYSHNPQQIQDDEQEHVNALVEDVSKDIGSNTGKLGVALDFLLVAEQLAQYDTWVSGFNPEITKSNILERFDTKDTKTLTFLIENDQVGIRPVHNKVIDLFRSDLNRTNFPSSPGHHTGDWESYDEMLVTSFRLSRPGRYEAVTKLIDLGLERLDAKTFQSRDPPFPRIFSKILKEYERKDSDEEAGSAYQAMAYGYVKAEWPHLSLRADKLRVGSSRQHRYGDIDGYVGADPMLSIEVKDKKIGLSNVDSELGTIKDLSKNSTTITIAMCKEVTDEAIEDLENSNVNVVTDEILAAELERWDYHKQNTAVQGMVHFFANIEQNPTAVQRLLRFIKKVDPENISLVHLDE
ncbi:hypothetical protein [Haloferax volcanii]|uniref:hypothetical protein n=1 Tax=Haloferax volcanii TaxID=2246 RepID=UPI00385C48DA